MTLMVLRLGFVVMLKKVAVVTIGRKFLGDALEATSSVTISCSDRLLGMVWDTRMVVRPPLVAGWKAVPVGRTDVTLRLLGRTMLTVTPLMGVGPLFLSVT
jgi:hypothetical protein